MSNLVEEILRELRRIDALNSFDVETDGLPRIPSLIDAGEFGSIITSQLIEKNISIISAELYRQLPDLKSEYTMKEWESETRRAFGHPLAEIDLESNLQEQSGVVLKKVKDNLASFVLNKRNYEHIFGCSLFHERNIRSLEIGPAKFEHRCEWLLRVKKSKMISSVVARRLEKTWSGKKTKARKPSRDSTIEGYILRAIGDCQFVCTVSTNSLGRDIAEIKAKLIARLAISAISLMWQRPSNVSKGMHLLNDLPIGSSTSAMFLPESQMWTGSSSRISLPSASWVEDTELNALLLNFSPIFKIVGECLYTVTNPSGSSSRPNMMNTLFHALMWFHEACRDPSSLTAVVKFAASLDALAQGGKARGIQNLIHSQIGMISNRQIWENGPTVKTAIEKIYVEGRSRTMHGNNPNVLHDWTPTRGIAEQFSRLCLLACIDWMIKNPAIDDPKQMSK